MSPLAGLLAGVAFGLVAAILVLWFIKLLRGVGRFVVWLWTVPPEVQKPRKNIEEKAPDDATVH